MLFVGVITVYLGNAILITEIFCYRYSTFNNSTKNDIL